MRIPIATLLVLAFWCAAAPARAESPEDEAKAAFERGKELFGEGEFAEAAAEFRRAHELRPNWRLLYNIAQSEAAAKQPGLALQAFEAYLAQGGDDVPMERRAECVAEIEQLRVMVGEVEVVAPDGAVVFVDGAEREKAPLPGPMMVAAGVEHSIRIELGDAVLLERQVRVSSGKRVSVNAEAGGTAGTSAKASGEPDAEPGGETSPLVLGGWIAAGIGAAALIGGAVTGGMTLSLDGDLEQRCDGGVCTEDDREDVDDLDTLALTTDILIGVGAAAAAVGIVLLIVGYGDEEEEADVALEPLVGHGLAGAGIRGRF